MLAWRASINLKAQLSLTGIQSLFYETVPIDRPISLMRTRPPSVRLLPVEMFCCGLTGRLKCV